jgi:hypothetical protein
MVVAQLFLIIQICNAQTCCKLTAVAYARVTAGPERGFGKLSNFIVYFSDRE